MGRIVQHKGRYVMGFVFIISGIERSVYLCFTIGVEQWHPAMTTAPQGAVVNFESC
jgi:hypothetical protein